MAEVGVVELYLLGELLCELAVDVGLCYAVEVFAGEWLGADEEAEDEWDEYENGCYGDFACFGVSECFDVGQGVGHGDTVFVVSHVWCGE